MLKVGKLKEVGKVRVPHADKRPMTKPKKRSHTHTNHANEHPTTTTMEPESALITKLHAKLSIFRRDRDDSLRRKELAVERARIVKNDRENAAAEVRAMQSKLLELREETKRKIGEVGGVESEVEGLNMEVGFVELFIIVLLPLLRLSSSTTKILFVHILTPSGQYKFQHSELNTKREKLSRLDAKVSTESSSRSASTTSSREALRRRRENSSSLNAPNLSLEEKKRQLEAFLEGEGGEDFMITLSDWISKRIESVCEEGEDVRRQCFSLEKRITGFQRAMHSGEQ